MTTPEQCRNRAEECVEFAQSARESDRPKFLELAEAWLKLADVSAPPGPTGNAPTTSKMQ